MRNHENYRVNQFQELVEIWYVDGVTIGAVSFCGFKKIKLKKH